MKSYPILATTALCAIFATLTLGACSEPDSVASVSASLRPGGDADGDGTPNGLDCAPRDSAIHPGATEVCNRVDDDCDGDVDEPVGSSYCVRVDELPTPADSCGQRRFVGILQGGTTCPQASAAWSTSELLANATSLGGSGFCAYEFLGAGHPSSLSGLPDDGTTNAADWLEPDCPAVGSQTPPRSRLALDAVYPDYAQGYLDQLEVEDHLPPVDVPGGASYPLPVTVAIVDTAPPVAAPPAIRVGGEAALLHHARVMGRVIESVACPDGVGSGLPCATEFSHHLAIDRRGLDAQFAPNGGNYGYISTLAVQIEDAVNQWLLRGRTSHLIINLSLGFEGRYAEGNWGTRASVQAVEAALDYASCHGALVFAAAGNRSYGPDGEEQTGPLLPAGMNTAMSSCGHPLVHAVGGVDALDQPLFDTRQEALADLVAPANFATVDVAPDGHPLEPLPLMTGSSLGVAAASGVAALLWSYRPELTREDVVLQLHDEGSVELTAAPEADLCTDGVTCGQPRRLSACAMLQSAVEQRCAASGSVPGCVPGAPVLACNLDRIPPHTGTEVQPSNIAPILLATGPSAAGLTDLVDSEDCPFPVLADQTWLPAHPELCPRSQYFNVELDPARVEEQPPPYGCSICADFMVSDEVYIALQQDWNVDIMGITLIVNGELQWDLSSAFASTGQFIQPGADATVTNLGQPSVINSAELEFALDHGSNQFSTVIVDMALWDQ